MFLVSRGSDRQNLHPFPLQRPSDRNRRRAADGEYDYHRLHDTQAQQSIHSA
jgi:hypothetical protein